MNLRLRQLELKDAKGMLEWMKDRELSALFRFDSDKITYESIKDFIESSKTDNRNKHFAIADNDDEYLGTISLKNIDNINKNAEYAISLRKCAIGKDVAKWATNAILNVAFIELDLHKVYLNVLNDNLRAIKFYEKIGFIYEGEFIDHLRIRDKWVSLKFYRIIRCEYENSYS